MNQTVQDLRIVIELKKEVDADGILNIYIKIQIYKLHITLI